MGMHGNGRREVEGKGAVDPPKGNKQASNSGPDQSDMLYSIILHKTEMYSVILNNSKH